MSMIEIENLTRRFGAFVAVDHISFRLERGEVLGFLGPNGAGKSTTMKMITGFLAPTSGTVRVGGHDVQRDPIAVKECIGYLPEGAPLWADMSAGRFLEFVAGVRGLSGAARVDRIRDVVEKTQIGSILAQPIDTLSKGFKRRVGLAQAFLHDPDVLILDEPTAGLDPNQIQEVRQTMQRLGEEKTILLSTHKLQEVESMANRVILINEGRLVYDGQVSELSEQGDGLEDAFRQLTTSNT